MAHDITLYKKDNTFYMRKITKKEDITKDEIIDGYIIDTDEKETRRILDTLKKRPYKIAIIGRDNTFNRRALETMNINYLIDPHTTNKKDTLKQRDSGLNHVTAKIAAKKNIAIIINITNLQTQNPKEKSKNLSRIMQNITICRKATCPIKVATFAKNKTQTISPIQRKAILTTLGANTQQTKESCEF